MVHYAPKLVAMDQRLLDKGPVARRPVCRGFGGGRRSRPVRDGRTETAAGATAGHRPGCQCRGCDQRAPGRWRVRCQPRPPVDTERPHNATQLKCSRASRKTKDSRMNRTFNVLTSARIEPRTNHRIRAAWCTGSRQMTIALSGAALQNAVCGPARRQGRDDTCRG